MDKKYIAQAEQMLTEWKEYDHSDNALVRQFSLNIKYMAELEKERDELAAELAAAKIELEELKKLSNA